MASYYSGLCDSETAFGQALGERTFGWYYRIALIYY